MSIALTGSATASGTGSLTFTIPGTVNVGDFLVVNVNVSGSATVSTTDPGWTLQTSGLFSTNRRFHIFSKFAETGFDTTPTFTYSVGASFGMGGLLAFSGVDAVTPYDVPVGTITTSPTTPVSGVTAITTVTNGAGIIMMGADPDGAVPPLGTWSNFATSNADPGPLSTVYAASAGGGISFSIGAAWDTQTTAGDTGTGSATLGDTTSWGAILLALRPAAPICVIGETQVLTPNGYVQIKDLKSGDFAIDSNGNPVQILYNIKGGSSHHFIKIEKNAIGNQQPNQDLYITAQHPLLIDGEERSCENLIDNKLITKLKLDHPKQLYSLCTKERLYVVMNGVNVCSWSDQEFKDFSHKKGKKYEIQ